MDDARLTSYADRCSALLRQRGGYTIMHVSAHVPPFLVRREAQRVDGAGDERIMGMPQMPNLRYLRVGTSSGENYVSVYAESKKSCGIKQTLSSLHHKVKDRGYILLASRFLKGLSAKRRGQSDHI